MRSVKVGGFSSILLTAFVSAGVFPKFIMTQESNKTTKPGLVVFDLDWTLWPFHVDTNVDPPFTRKGSKIVDRYGEVISHFPEVPQILEYLKDEGIPMAVASRTSEIKGAKQLLDIFGWNKYFDHKEIYPGGKKTHFGVFQRATDLPYTSMMFFDDEYRNIRDISNIGVHCVYVKNGVSMKLIKESLADFAKKNQSNGRDEL